MNSKKQREKNRRRANKLAREAWEAAEDQRIDLAIKIIQRAVDLNPANPVLWHDRGSLLDFNALHQDIRGDVFFPIQLVVVLSARADPHSNDPEAFTGGEFLFCDQPERKPSDRSLTLAGLGDAVLFCTRARLMRVGGVYGLKTVKHGLNEITSGTRYAIGIPFHEFR